MFVLDTNHVSELTYRTAAGFPNLICGLARQREHPIKCFMNVVVKIRNPRSGFTLITDRSVNTPQTRPVVQ
jgi:hypothetical protein